jgi:hypothetical protein
VFLEGHILDGEERDRLLRAVRDAYAGLLHVRTAYLEADLETAIQNRVRSRYWHPELLAPSREPTIRAWITSHVPRADSYDKKIDGNRPVAEVLVDLVSTLEIDLK